MSARPGRIEVVIDELVLHGFEARQRDGIVAALRAELAAALEGWTRATGTSVDHLHSRPPDHCRRPVSAIGRQIGEPRSARKDGTALPSTSVMP